MNLIDYKNLTFYINVERFLFFILNITYHFSYFENINITVWKKGIYFHENVSFSCIYTMKSYFYMISFLLQMYSFATPPS